MTHNHHILLEQYLKLPDLLEQAIAGLSPDGLDLAMETGWSIRAYVHHTVEGEWMWQLFLRAMLGTSGMEIPIQWYFQHTQDEWAEHWASEKREIAPSLALFRGSTSSLVELLGNVPASVWDHYGRVTWPGREQETKLTVQDIIRIHIGHVDQHAKDIRIIRELHHS